MVRNMGKLDRVLRSAAAAGAVALILNGSVKGTSAVALGTLASLFLFTSSVGHCPVYAATGLNTLTAID
jgi:hypothetical protein